MNIVLWWFRLGWLVTLLLWIPAGNTIAAGADDEPEADSVTTADTPHARIYRNPEERREAGLGRQVTDWLRISGLLEFENERFDEDYDNNIQIKREPGATSTLQLGLDVTFSDAVTAELVFESEHDRRTRSRLDEGLISIDLEPWGIEAGRLYVPFGEYYSHFVEGPLLEFGETRKDALVVDYTIAGAVEIAVYTFDSKVNLQSRQNTFDWGINFDYTNDDESIRLGTGYLSDLAESEEKLLEEFGNSVERRVAAWNAYALIGFYPFEFTIEYIDTTDRFVELDANTDQPSAYNIEFAWFPAESTQLAFRLEGSDEFSDAPEKQWGINWTWRPGSRFLLSVDYLHGEYQPGFILDDDDNELRRSNIIATQIAIEF